MVHGFLELFELGISKSAGKAHASRGVMNVGPLAIVQGCVNISLGG